MHPRIIAELGINHDGSAEIARTLIEAAARAGAWGIKFQYRNLTNTYADDARQIGDEILQNEIVRNYLSPDEILDLSRLAIDLGVKPGISFFTPDDIADFGENISTFAFFKVPSVEFTNSPLIKRLEGMGEMGLISTGAYDEEKIQRGLKNTATKFSMAHSPKPSTASLNAHCANTAPQKLSLPTQR